MPNRLSAIPDFFIAPDKRSLSAWAYVFLFLLCLASFTPGLVNLPPTDRDESSFAQATKQMIETGNYVDIRLQDKPRYKKPIGIYWLQAASVRLLNPDHLNEIWAYRIPSFLGATLAVLMTAALGSLLFNPMTGLLAAIMMAGCVILNVEARLAKTDAALLGSIMVMQYALARSFYARRSGTRPDAYNVKTEWGTALAFWTALGAGILIKGPIILLVLCSTLLWLKVTEKKLKWLSKLKPLAGFAYLLLLVVPWFLVIILQSHGSFLAQSAGHDLFAKLWEGQGRGIMPPGLHLLILPVMFFPFALYVTLAVPDTLKNRNHPAIRFCLGWIVPTWVIFELSLTKLPHYTLPAYPAIAMLAAKALLDGYPVLREKAGKLVWSSVIGLWLTVGVGFAVAFALLPDIFDERWSSLQIAASPILIITQGIALLLLFRRKINSVLVLAAGNLCFMAVVFGSTVPSLQHLWMSQQLAKAVENVKPCEHSSVVSASYGEPSLVFLTGTNTQIVPDGTSAASIMKADHCKVGLIDARNEKSFVNAFPQNRFQPIATGIVYGLNTGRGHTAEVTLYIMPSDKPIP